MNGDAANIGIPNAALGTSLTATDIMSLQRDSTKGYAGLTPQPYPASPTPKVNTNFHVRSIRNGFILALGNEEYHCADIGAVGQRVTTLLAEMELKK